MPFSRKHGTWFWVNQKSIDRAKKRASKKNQSASESVREEDENDPVKDESHIHARAYDMTTSASNTKPKVSSTDSESSSIHTTESSMQCVETEVASTEIKASAIELEAPSVHPTESSMQCVETEAVSTDTKASPIASGAPSTSPNESKMPCVETQELVVAVYFISRSFRHEVIEKVLRHRFGESHDPKTVFKALSVLKNDNFFHGKDQYDLDLVDLWLNMQTSYEYENLLFLTEVDDGVRKIAQEAVSARVLYARSLNLPNIRDKMLMKSHI